MDYSFGKIIQNFIAQASWSGLFLTKLMVAVTKFWYAVTVKGRSKRLGTLKPSLVRETTRLQ